MQRLVKNGFQFTESYRAKRNRELAKRGNNNVFDFLESEGYIRLKSDASTSSKELYKDRILMHIENFTMLIGMLENSLCDHHNAVMAAHPCEVPKKHFEKMRSLPPPDAVQGFGISQQAFCKNDRPFSSST